MIKAYFNHTKVHVYIHRNINCGYTTMNRDQGKRREIKINRSNLNIELSKFANNEYVFKQKAGFHGLWVHIDLADQETEIETVQKIHKILKNIYRKFERVEPEIAC